MRPAVIVFASVLLLSPFAARVHAENPPAKTGTAASDQTPAAPRPVQASPVPRWLEPVTFSGGLLDQNQRDARGATTLAQLRAQLQVAGRVRLTPGGALGIYAGGGTGPSFRSGWNHTPLGSQPGVSTLHVKHLFASLRPGSHAELQVGSMPAYRGYATEMTGFDNDAFITGARLVVKARRAFWFDEIGITRAHVGDLTTPSAFDRLHRLADTNAFQAVAARRTALGSASFEFFDRPGARTVGGALQTTRVPHLSAVRIEALTAVAGASAHAVAVAADRRIRSVTATLGASHADAPLGTLNGDRYGAGSRLFGLAVWRPFPPVAVTAFGSRSVGDVQEPRTRVDFVATYDVLRSLAARR